MTVLTVNQAAEAIGVSRRTIYLWIAAGKLGTVRTASGRLRIDRASLWRRRDGRRWPRTDTVPTVARQGRTQ